MEPLKYRVNIRWSIIDDCFIAEVPELPGCAADGNTYEEVITNVQEVMSVWLYTAKEMNRAIPEPNHA